MVNVIQDITSLARITGKVCHRGSRWNHPTVNSDIGE